MAWAKGPYDRENGLDLGRTMGKNFARAGAPYRVVPENPPPPDRRPVPFEPPTAHDRVVVEQRQLRHRATYMLGITRRCRHGYPQAFLCTPLRIVGSTIAAESAAFWLSCPLLVRAVDALEAEGWIRTLEDRVRKDPALWTEVKRVHQSVIELRRGLLPADWLRRLETDPALKHQRWILFQTGLAGITRPDHVKCLHAHLADYLSRGANPLGRIVAELLKRRRIPLEGTPDCWRCCRPELCGTPESAAQISGV